MQYKVRVDNGIAVLGWLCNGKVKAQPRWYPHPSSARRAAESYAAKHPGHDCVVMQYDRTKAMSIAIFTTKEK